MTKTSAIYDRMINANGDEVSTLCMAMIDRMQIKLDEPGTQLAACGALVVLLAAHHGVEPLDVFRIGANVVERGDHFNKRKRFAAVRGYIEEEIPRV